MDAVTKQATLAALARCRKARGCISAICWELGVPTNRDNLRTVRAHLTALRHAGLVKARQSGVQTIYSAN